MILGRILDHLREREVAGIGEIAAAIGSTTDAVRPMLQMLERKGLVHLWQARPGCGPASAGCSSVVCHGGGCVGAAGAPIAGEYYAYGAPPSARTDQPGPSPVEGPD